MLECACVCVCGVVSNVQAQVQQGTGYNSVHVPGQAWERGTALCEYVQDAYKWPAGSRTRSGPASIFHLVMLLLSSWSPIYRKCISP